MSRKRCPLHGEALRNSDREDYWENQCPSVMVENENSQSSNMRCKACILRGRCLSPRNCGASSPSMTIRRPFWLETNALGSFPKTGKFDLFRADPSAMAYALPLEDYHIPKFQTGEQLAPQNSPFVYHTSLQSNVPGEFFDFHSDDLKFDQANQKNKSCHNIGNQLSQNCQRGPTGGKNLAQRKSGKEKIGLCVRKTSTTRWKKAYYDAVKNKRNQEVGLILVRPDGPEYYAKVERNRMSPLHRSPSHSGVSDERTVEIKDSGYSQDTNNTAGSVISVIENDKFKCEADTTGNERISPSQEEKYALEMNNEEIASKNDLPKLKNDGSMKEKLLDETTSKIGGWTMRRKSEISHKKNIFRSEKKCMARVTSSSSTFFDGKNSKIEDLESDRMTNLTKTKNNATPMPKGADEKYISDGMNSVLCNWTLRRKSEIPPSKRIFRSQKKSIPKIAPSTSTISDDKSSKVEHWLKHDQVQYQGPSLSEMGHNELRKIKGRKCSKKQCRELISSHNKDEHLAQLKIYIREYLDYIEQKSESDSSHDDARVSVDASKLIAAVNNPLGRITSDVALNVTRSVTDALVATEKEPKDVSMVGVLKKMRNKCFRKVIGEVHHLQELVQFMEAFTKSHRL